MSSARRSRRGRVDVGTDAEGEDAAAMGIGLGGEVADGALGGAADRGQAVGEEENQRQEARGRDGSEGFGQGVVQVGAAIDPDPGQERPHPAHRGGGLEDRLRGEGLDGVAVDDDVEGLAFVEGLDDLQGGRHGC